MWHRFAGNLPDMKLFVPTPVGGGSSPVKMKLFLSTPGKRGSSAASRSAANDARTEANAVRQGRIMYVKDVLADVGVKFYDTAVAVAIADTYDAIAEKVEPWQARARFTDTVRAIGRRLLDNLPNVKWYTLRDLTTVLEKAVPATPRAKKGGKAESTPSYSNKALSTGSPATDLKALLTAYKKATPLHRGAERAALVDKVVELARAGWGLEDLMRGLDNPLKKEIRSMVAISPATATAAHSALTGAVGSQAYMDLVSQLKGGFPWDGTANKQRTYIQKSANVPHDMLDDLVADVSLHATAAAVKRQRGANSPAFKSLVKQLPCDDTLGNTLCSLGLESKLIDRILATKIPQTFKTKATGLAMKTGKQKETDIGILVNDILALDLVIRSGNLQKQQRIDLVVDVLGHLYRKSVGVAEMTDPHYADLIMLLKNNQDAVALLLTSLGFVDPDEPDDRLMIDAITGDVKNYAPHVRFAPSS